MKKDPIAAMQNTLREIEAAIKNVKEWKAMPEPPTTFVGQADGWTLLVVDSAVRGTASKDALAVRLTPELHALALKKARKEPA